jgi:pyridoxal phosphate enzyme (YggS family)
MSIADNLDRVREEVAQACLAAQRKPAEVALLAVSKVHPVEFLIAAHAAGQRLFGENRVQEWQEKSASAAALPGLEMHLIGPLQSNKSARAVELFQAIDTVDSLKIATRLNDAARTLNKRLPILIEIKLSPEESKHGLEPSNLPALLNALAALEFVVPSGLMTVAPWPTDLSRANEEARPYFAALRRLRDQSAETHPSVQSLSMGMSNDFVAAIAEGSTCVRIGTAIFGKRPPA